MGITLQIIITSTENVYEHNCPSSMSLAVDSIFLKMYQIADLMLILISSQYPWLIFINPDKWPPSELQHFQNVEYIQSEKSFSFSPFFVTFFFSYMSAAVLSVTEFPALSVLCYGTSIAKSVLLSSFIFLTEVTNFLLHLHPYIPWPLPPLILRPPLPSACASSAILLSIPASLPLSKLLPSPYSIHHSLPVFNTVTDRD